MSDTNLTGKQEITYEVNWLLLHKKKPFDIMRETLKLFDRKKTISLGNRKRIMITDKKLKVKV